MVMSEFIEYWRRSSRGELGGAQRFILDLCEVLEIEAPARLALEFEYNTQGRRRCDLYKPGYFMAELKRGRDSRREPGNLPVRGRPAYDAYMERAYNSQLREYVKSVEDPPPLLMLIDIGYKFWIWPVFGGELPNFRSPTRIEIPFAELDKPENQDILRSCFNDPAALDRRQCRQQVTEQLARELAELMGRLEVAHDRRSAADFVIQLIFCMFADSVGLLPYKLIAEVASVAAKHGDEQGRVFSELFEVMRRGGRFRGRELVAFGETIVRHTRALPLAAEELRLLARLAEREWQHLDPTVLGTLLENALLARERRNHGIHYTPREFVERLVDATLEPLELRWWAVQGQFRQDCRRLGLGLDDRAGADVDKATLATLGHHASKTLAPFHRELTSLRVLDPACGTGNFLAVAYQRVRGLEHEYRDFLTNLLGGQQSFEMLGQTVMPEQFIGIERDLWASEIAQLVLFIAHIQWAVDHSGRGPIRPDEQGRRAAVIEAMHSCRRSIAGDTDALLGEGGEPRPWPKVDYIVGNPPFVGNKQMRAALGDEYVESLRSAYPEVPGSVDFVMYWWHRAAAIVGEGKATRAGLITTNSIRQVHNRQVVDAALTARAPVRIAWALADHPWIDRGTAVRIAMTVIERADPHGDPPAKLGFVVHERSGQLHFELVERIHADLRGGVDLASAGPLRANAGVCFQGMNLVGKAGFVVTAADMSELGYDPERPPALIRPYLGGREFLHERRGQFVIDAHDYDEVELRRRHPRVHERLVERVLPARRTNARKAYRDRWWVFGEPRKRLREAIIGLEGMFVTCETARWRTFEFCDAAVVPDHQLYVVAHDHPFVLGVLLSRVHRVWAAAKGGRQGVGNDPRYTSTQCFATFPFADPEPELRERIARHAAAVDAGRKALREFDPRWTLARIQELLDEHSRPARLDQFLQDRSEAEASVFTQLQSDWLALENSVGEAYGFPCMRAIHSDDPDLARWSGRDDDPPSDADILRELLRLNRVRRREEQIGHVRWLRSTSSREPMVLTETLELDGESSGVCERQWPKSTVERLLALQVELRTRSRPPSLRELADHFGARTNSVEPMLRVLIELGVVEHLDEPTSSGRYRIAPRRWVPPITCNRKLDPCLAVGP